MQSENGTTAPNNSNPKAEVRRTSPSPQRTTTARKTSAKAQNSSLWKIIIAVVGLSIIATIVILIIVKNAQPKEEISIYSEKAAEIDPTNYSMEETTSETLKSKFNELMVDTPEPNKDATLEYFTGEINRALNSGNKEQACKILWLEQDLFMNIGFPQYALEALLRMDDTKLEKYQKIYLYRAIVTASVITGDKVTEDKYTALVMELDPPTVINEESVEEVAPTQEPAETPAE